MIAAIVALCLTPGTAHAQQLTAADDREVLDAVVEQSIRPWLALERDIAGVPAGPLIVRSESLQACAGPGSTPPVCAAVEALRTPDDQGFVTGAWDYRDETRGALADAFNSRNARSESLPLRDIPDVLPVLDDGALHAAGSTHPADFVIAISLPGYVSNGFAVVYAHATREGRARQGWAFILSRASGRWTVQHAYLLWMRR